MTGPTPARPVPTANPVLKRALRYGAILALAIAVVVGVIGGIVAGGPGVAGALIGTAMALVFTGITAVSILLANRFTGSDLFVGAFFGIVLGSWLVKFVVFIVLSLALKGQPWLNPLILFISIVAGVIGSLIVDLVVVARSRVPYASDVELPEQAPDSSGDDRS
ncbi:MAG: hypothetical protein EPN48_13240 [Microbacteriaceae bacterium]|nr:MAG: hypothetical protein EPN48_13240 [Microbacteriaceae bacterium]